MRYFVIQMLPYHKLRPDSKEIWKRAIFAYYLLTKLEGLLIVQSARRPVGGEKLL
jgi:hypothetical protein